MLNRYLQRIVIICIVLLTLDLWQLGRKTNHQPSFVNAFCFKPSLRSSPTTSSSLHTLLPTSNPIRSPHSLRLYEFGQDELPNLFGINPLEATVLFTFAYYFLGSERLYEYAREAGKLFSTYFPIIQQAVSDIVYEFRDYLEEDRERSMLEKAGMDVSRLPRKTTNILERIQKSFEAIGELTESVSSTSTAGTGGGRSITTTSSNSKNDEDNDDLLSLAEDGGSIQKNKDRKRKTKRELLEEKKRKTAKAEIQETTISYNTSKIENSTNLINSDDSFSTVSPLSLNADSDFDDIDDIDDITIAKSSPVYDENFLQNAVSSRSPDSDELPTPPPESSPQPLQSSPPPPLPARLNPGLSRFQQQLTGEWNQKVLRREKYEVPATYNNPFANKPSPFLPPPSFELLDDEEGEDYPIFDEQSIHQFHQTDTIISSSIPHEIDGEVNSLPFFPLLSASSNSSFINSSEASDGSQSAIELLKQFDEDYMKLRSKLLRLIQDQQHQATGNHTINQTTIPAVDSQQENYAQNERSSEIQSTYL